MHAYQYLDACEAAGRGPKGNKEISLARAMDWTANKSQGNRVSLKGTIVWSETLRKIIDEALVFRRNPDAPDDLGFGNLHGRDPAFIGAQAAHSLRPKENPCRNDNEVNRSRSNSKFGMRNAHVLVGTLADNRMMLAEWTGLEPATPGVTGRYSNQLNYHSMRLALRCSRRAATTNACHKPWRPLGDSNPCSHRERVVS